MCYQPHFESSFFIQLELFSVITVRSFTHREWKFVSAFFGLIGAMLLFAVFVLPILDRHQRIVETKEAIAQAQARIQEQGGWPAIEVACLKLADDATATNGAPFLNWRRGSQNPAPLPPVIGSLKPYSIQLQPDGAGLPMMTVRLHNYRSMIYGFCVVCTNVSAGFQLPADLAKLGRQQVANRVGERTYELR